jgi:uncharacterized protein YqjF (DUF2071 family)
MWSRLGVERAGTRMRYAGRRRVGGPSASYDVVVDVGDALEAEEVIAFDRFLTARFALFACYGRMLARTRVAHAPWPLRRATPVRVRETLLRAAGLPDPAGPPVVHWSLGVSVRIAPPDGVPSPLVWRSR